MHDTAHRRASTGDALHGPSTRLGVAREGRAPRAPHKAAGARPKSARIGLQAQLYSACMCMCTHNHEAATPQAPQGGGGG